MQLKPTALIVTKAMAGIQARSTTTPANIEKLEKYASFLGLETFRERALMNMVAAACIWHEALRNKHPGRWLTLLGCCGTGKTHVAKRLWEKCSGQFQWHTMRYPQYFVYWPDFVQKLRAGEAFSVRDDMKRWPLLVLDDVGAERDTTGFAAEELHTLLGCRMGRWTIITANLTLERIGQIDARIASRMIRDNNLVVEVEAEDYALRKLNGYIRV